MNGIREVIRRFGMPDAISWSGFWVTFLSALIGNFVTNAGPVPLLTRIGILLLGSVVLWGVMLAARGMFFRDPTRSRPLIMLIALVIGVILRALAVGAMFGLLLGADEAKFGARFLGAIINTGLAFVVTSSVVGAFRERRRQIAMLQAQRMETDTAIAQVSSGIAERNEQAVERVRGVLVRELSALDGTSADQSLRVLQSTAADVVRPMSHELANAVPAAQARSGESRAVTVSWPAVIDDAASGRPFSPWLVALLTAIETLGALLHDPRGAIAYLGLLGFLVGLVALANRVLERVLTGKSRGVRIALVVLSALVVGALTGAVAILLRGTASVNVAIGVALGCFIVGFSLGTAVVLAVGRERDRMILELELSSRSLEHSLVRLRQAQWFQQKALSRALHGPVQMAVTGAAIRLDAAIRENSISPGLIHQVQEELLASLDVLHESGGEVISFDRGLERMRAAWEGVCEINAEVSAEVAECIASDGIVRSILIDIVTEAVSNAVRHGKATHVRIAVTTSTAEQAELIIRVHNDGAESGDFEGRGLGSRLLDECTVTWSRRPVKGGQELLAALPIA